MADVARGNENERRLARSILAVQTVAVADGWRYLERKSDVSVLRVVLFTQEAKNIEKGVSDPLAGKCLLGLENKDIVLIEEKQLPTDKSWVASWRVDLVTREGTWMDKYEETQISFVERVTVAK